MNNFEDVQKFGKENMDLVMSNFGNMTKTMQAIASEMGDYSKKSLEDGASAYEKLMATRSLDKAMEVQSEYAKTAYEGFAAQMTKVGEMFGDVTKDAYKPFEAMVAKATK